MLTESWGRGKVGDHPLVPATSGRTSTSRLCVSMGSRPAGKLAGGAAPPMGAEPPHPKYYSPAPHSGAVLQPPRLPKPLPGTLCLSARMPTQLCSTCTLSPPAPGIQGTSQAGDKESDGFKGEASSTSMILGASSCNGFA